MNAGAGPRARFPLAWSLLACAAAVLLLAPLILATSGSLWLRWLAIMALAWWLPGALLVAHWRLPALDQPTAIVMALGMGLCWMVAMALLVHMLPGPIELWLLVAAFEAGALGLLVCLWWRRPVVPRPVSGGTWSWLLVLLLLGVLLRLPGIGYHELHVDETTVLRRASKAIEGEDDALTRHTKGTGQVAVAIVVYRALGTVTEATARLPFGLVGVASILALALLGRRLFSAPVGFWAGVLLALNGFALGLSRIVQYQPAVMLLSALAVLAGWEFSRRSESRWLALALVLSAFGLAMHYEFALLGPVLLVLVVVGLRRAPDRQHLLWPALAGGILGTLVVAAAYLPLVLGSHLDETQGYLSSRLGGFGAFNLALFVELGTFYNSSYYFFGLILLVAAGVLIGCRTARRRTLLLVLWFLPFLILHILIVRDPGTHFYLVMESWALLAALPLAALTRSGGMRPVLRWGLLVLVALWLVVSVGYVYLVFFQQKPEYLADFRDQRLPAYWVPYGDDAPLWPRFGFPVQQGWKTVGLLGQWGYLGDHYASNERMRHLPWWYVTSMRRVSLESDPEVVLVTAHQQEPNLGFDGDRLDDYRQVGEIRVWGEPRIEIWERHPFPGPYLTLEAEQFEAHFDRTVPRLEDRYMMDVNPLGVTLGGLVALDAAGLERTTLSHGDTLHALLVWRPLQALPLDCKVFLHVADAEGRPFAQWDAPPMLGRGHTSQWAAGEAMEDHILLTIPEDVPPGRYSVLVGLYDGASGERLGGQAAQVGEITIR